MNKLLEQFLLEARDLVEQVEEKLLALEGAPGDTALIGELFRLVHTIKGNSGLLGFEVLVRVAHAAEDLLDGVREGRLEYHSELADDLLSAVDFVRRLLDEIEAKEGIPARFQDEAGELAACLRARLPAAQDDGARLGTVASQVSPATDWSWLMKLSESLREAAFAAGAQSGHLLAVRYVPEPDCFFKGEDPLFTVRNTPGLVGLAISMREPWPGPENLDIYRANLVFNLLSAAPHDDVAEHFRYVPEQVHLYDLPVEALALPTGNLDDGHVHRDFVLNARRRLTKGDRPGLEQAVANMLETVNPDLWVASALRWMRRLLSIQAENAVVEALLIAIEEQQAPDWQALLGERLVADDQSSVQLRQKDEQPPQAPKRQLSEVEEALWTRILDTQRRILNLPVPAAQWAGQLAAITATLSGLYRYQGDERKLAALEEAASRAEREKTFAPLSALLGAPAPSDSVSTPTMVEAEPKPIEPAVMTQAPRPSTGASREGAEVKSDRRDEDGSADKSVKVLKVSQEKVDRLMELIGEMVVAKNALPYLAARAENVFGSRELSREIKAQYTVINRIAQEMQDAIMQVRMLPVGAVLQRFPRLVRDVAKNLEKEVRLVVEGEDTEADKNIIEALADPLIHIVRNSLDHGIEPPEMRQAAGKPREGQLSIRARQEGDRVLIEVTDDGKGIDPEMVKRKAFEKGLIDEARLEAMSDQEAIQLVFLPGFSTAETISDLSGRGVGMDVVRTAMDKMGGAVRLISEKGRGTTVILDLPLSMAVSHVMMVQYAGQNFGVPMDYVVETVRVAAGDIHTFEDRQIAVLRGRVVSLHGLDKLLHLADVPRPNADGEHAVLVVRVGGDTMGLLVDGFSQTIDVILKPLEGPLAGLRGIAGTALLGDGSILLVLNLKELI